MRALVVEDDAFSRAATGVVLRSMGFEVTAVRSAAEARWFLTSSPCDVVVLDLVLPDGRGTEVLELIRQMDLHVKVAVIGTGDDLALAPAIELRADTVLEKPLALDALRGCWTA